MRLRLASTNRSSASPQTSVVETDLPSVIAKTPSSAGARKITRTWRRAWSKAIGKLAPRSVSGHFPMASVVQGHRKIGTSIGQRPFSDLFLRDAIHDGDAAGSGHVDEDLACI